MRRALDQAHTYLEIKFGLCPAALLYEAVPGGTIAAIAPIYVHAVVNEDSYVQKERQGKAALFEFPEWASRLAFPPKVALDSIWPGSFRTDIEAFRQYAKAVYAASDRYLAGLSDGDLAAEVPKQLVELKDGVPSVTRRSVPLAFDFEDMVTLHFAEHAGEVSALLGVRGLKGSPWG